MQKEYLTLKEASQYLGISPKTFKKNIEPKLNPLPVGRKKLFKRSDIDELRFGGPEDTVKTKKILQGILR